MQKVALVLLRVAAVVVTLFGWLCVADSLDDLLRKPIKPSDYVLCFVTCPLTVLGLAALSGLVFWQARRLGQQFTWPQFGVLTLAWAAGVSAWFWLVLGLTFGDQLFIYRAGPWRSFERSMPLTEEKLLLACVFPVAGGACGLAAAAIWAVLNEPLETPTPWRTLLPKFLRAALLGGAGGAGLQLAMMHLAGLQFGYGKLAGTTLAGYTVGLVAAAFALSWIGGRGVHDGAGRLLWRGAGGIAAAFFLGIGAGLLSAASLFTLAFVQDPNGTLDRLARELHGGILLLPFLIGSQAVFGVICLVGGGWLYYLCVVRAPAAAH